MSVVTMPIVHRILIVGLTLFILTAVGCGPEKHLDDTLVWTEITDVPNFPRADKPIFLYLNQNNCPYCSRMEDSILTRPEIAWYLNEYFRFVNINMDEDMPVTLAGKEYTYRDFWNTFHLEGLPTYFCFDSLGRPNGILHGEQDVLTFKRFLKYVRLGHFGKTPWTKWLEMPEAELDTLYGIF